MVPHPEPGLVIRYNFLWGREASDRHQNARKSRPCAIVTSVRQAGDKIIVTVAPITHSPPIDSTTIEIPLPAKRLLGLDEERSWIVVNELNSFIWPGPDLEPIERGSKVLSYGRLPRPLALKMLRMVLVAIRSGEATVVKGTQ